ncbi:MAG: RHS repeat domain-containing protein, partial [Streptosporangiaceae bacterium]
MPYVAASGAAAPAGTPETTTSYDALSRPLVVTDGGGGTMSYAYSGNDVLAARGPAPAGENLKRRQEEFDGLGRLSSVCEVTGSAGSGSCSQTSAQTGYWTKYARSPLGGIAEVTQNAQGSPVEIRYYTRDWMGRMISESNPESGQTYFYYDGDSVCGDSKGDLLRRVDAAGNVTCYGYDALHRLTQISYPSGPNAAATPTKTFVYDSASGLGITAAPYYSANYQAGRLVAAYTGPASAPIVQLGFGYDANGRRVWTAESTPHSGGWYTVNGGYYPDGTVGSINLNNLPQFQWGVDAEGRLSDMGVYQGPTLAVAAHNPAGEVTSVAFWSGDSDTFSYDPGTGRMTGYKFGVGASTDGGTLAWNTNGSLASLVINDQIPGTSDSGSCNYSHDDLGRIAGVNCGGGQPDLTFSFDPFGNLSVGGTPAGLATSPVYSNNRMVQNGGVSQSFDADGNLLDDPVIPARGVNSYDAEGKAVTFENAGVTYDAMGRAVETSGTNGTEEFLYGPEGRKLAVMSGQTTLRADIPLPGGDEAVYEGTTLAYYRRADRLGSERLASTPAGTLYSARALTPYGAPYGESGQFHGGAYDRSFTGMKQDIASSKYDFMMREYEPVMGRWFTPDPAGGAAVDPNNPQSWNRYAYVNNNPLSAVDPSGMDGQLYIPGQSNVQCTLDGISTDCGSINLQDSDLCINCGPNGEPPPVETRTWILPLMSSSMGCEGEMGGDPGCSGASPMQLVTQGYWQYTIHYDYQLAGCGAMNFGCQFFSGFVNLFLNGRASGLGQMAEAESRAGLL